MQRFNQHAQKNQNYICKGKYNKTQRQEKRKKLSAITNLLTVDAILSHIIPNRSSDLT